MSHSLSEKWWQEATIYHIYPRSFRDSNGDGIGDLGGIIEKLPYLVNLGIDAIWMGPVFRSPQADNGYDVSDYRDIDPTFGTIGDMDKLIEVAGGYGVRVLLDLVLNHTSHMHPWFLESARSNENNYADYYIWRDSATDGGPPNDWQASFGGDAWSFCSARGQYYLHLFSPEQPDLNWANPQVRAELADVANFWIDRGAAGFRLDVINHISKADGLPDLQGKTPSGVYIDGPDTLRYLQEFRSSLKGNGDIVLVGETPGVTIDAARAYTDPCNSALDMVLVFDHVSIDHGPGGKWDPKEWEVPTLVHVTERLQDAFRRPRRPTLYISNHDQPRSVSRYGDDSHYRYASATAIAAYFYLQRGTPIVYQGDEIGMANYPIESPQDLADVESRNAFQELVDEFGLSAAEALARVRPVARDHGRTPMQWNAEPGAGFSCSESVQPWFPVNPDHIEWNVASQLENDETVLGFYKRLIRLQRASLFSQGDFQTLAYSEEAAAYVRRWEQQCAVVLVSFVGRCCELTLERGADPETGGTSAGEPQGGGALLTVRCSNYRRPAVSAIALPTARGRAPASVAMRPYECLVALNSVAQEQIGTKLGSPRWEVS